VPETPVRVWKRRVPGWKGDRDPFYVGRPGPFCNPYELGERTGLARVPAADLVTPWEYEGRISAAGMVHEMVWPSGQVTRHTIRYMTVVELVQTYRSALLYPRPGLALVHRRGHQLTRVTVDLVRDRLAGRDLSCWCRPGDPCHADVLLWAANAPDGEIRAAVAAEETEARAMAARVLALHPELGPKEKVA
jgi:hypothetical protein